ncbi:MAG TPA: glycosyltransferase [Streptosporangiaceae bacterium]
MKIALVGLAHPYKGGSAQHTTALAHRLAAAGHQVTLQSWRAHYPRLLYSGDLTLSDPEQKPEVELFPDTAWSLGWLRPHGWWRTGRRLARRADVIVLAIFTPFQVPAYLALARAAHVTGRRVVALCHNVLPHERHRIDLPLMRAMLRAADVLVVHSAREAALAASIASTPAEIAALPLHLPHARHARASHRPADDADDARPYNRLLFFGMVRPYKGLDVLLRALAEVRPIVSLTVAGQIWAGKDELLRLIGHLKLADRVQLNDGYVAAGDVPSLFASVDALVLPYRSATASQNALIGLQFGIPVVATRAGAIADPLVDGVNGLLCEPGNAADLARAINRLYEPGMLPRLRRGVHPPETTRDWEEYIATMEKAISGPGG